MSVKLSLIIQSIPDLWIVRGDEELSEFNYKSRTNSQEWKDAGNLPQTPSVFRFDKAAVPNNNDWRVDITPMDREIRRINNFNDALVDGYLYADATAMFNGTGFPRQQYLTMSFNRLQGIKEGNYLKFFTMTPASNTAGMTYLTHPHYVHKWDIVTMRDGSTVHVNTPKGDVFHFLTSREGIGYIPIDYVRRA